MIQFHHVLPLQIRFNDVDKFGHVNNTVYFQFYDTAKTDYIASVCKGVDWERLAIVVVKIDAEFVAQIKANDHIAGRTRVVKIGKPPYYYFLSFECREIFQLFCKKNGTEIQDVIQVIPLSYQPVFFHQFHHLLPIRRNIPAQ